MKTNSYLKVPDAEDMVNPIQNSSPKKNLNSTMLSKERSHSFSNVAHRSNSPTNNPRIAWKVVVLGDAGVGKSSLVKQFLTGYFTNAYTPTVEDNFIHTISLADGLNQDIEILDTSGYYQFPAMRELNIRLALGIVLVFDINRDESLNSLCELYETIKKIKGEKSSSIILVGNKTDICIDDKGISKRASNLAEKIFHCVYIETSAKENKNVNDMFHSLFEEIYKKLEDELQQALLQNGVTRRGSAASFVRRFSISSVTKPITTARRHSEPAVKNDLITEKVNSKKTNGNTKKRLKKQRNCVIS